MKTIKVGVLGLGVGEQHIITYQDIPDVEVVAVCDIDPKKLKVVADRRDVPIRVEDYRAITEDQNIDVVSICTHDDFHAEQAVSAFENGKHVFIEKPIALYRKEAESIFRAYKDSGKKISSNLILRTEPRFIEVKRMIDDGEFGEIVSIEADYVHDILWKIVDGWRGKMDFYCVAYGGGIHMVDLMRWLTGQEVTHVCGMSNKILTRNTSFHFDDVIYNLLRFERGAIGKTMTSFGPPRTKFHSLNVYGEKKVFVNDRPGAKIFDGDSENNEHSFDVPYPTHRKGGLLPDFIDAIRQGREPEVSSKDVFRVMDICFAMWETSQNGLTAPVSYLE